MPRELTATLFGVTLLALSGCAEPAHLTHDYARAYREAFATQADLSRASVEQAAYQMQGLEAVVIRLRALQASTDQESEETTLSND